MIKIIWNVEEEESGFIGADYLGRDGFFCVLCCLWSGLPVDTAREFCHIS